MAERNRGWLQEVARHFSPRLNAEELQIRREAAVYVADKLRITYLRNNFITGAYLFGSIATGEDARSSSDIDLALITEVDLFSLELYYFDLEDEMKLIGQKYLQENKLPKVRIDCKLCPRKYLNNPSLISTSKNPAVDKEKVLEVFTSVVNTGIRIFDYRQQVDSFADLNGIRVGK